MRVQGYYNIFARNTVKTTNTATDKKQTQTPSSFLTAYKTNKALSVNTYEEIKNSKEINHIDEKRLRPDQEAERINNYLRREKNVSNAYKNFGMGNFVNFSA